MLIKNFLRPNKPCKKALAFIITKFGAQKYELKHFANNNRRWYFIDKSAAVYLSSLKALWFIVCANNAAKV